MLKPATVHWLRQALPPAEAAQVAFEGSLEELGTVRLELAQTARQRRLRAGHELGPLGVLGFVAAPLRLGPRDEHLGWTQRARVAHIGRVVANDRLLLLAGVRVPNLASHVLGQARRRLAPDWHRRHRVRPLLLETCVQASRPGRGGSWSAAGRKRRCW